MNKLTATTPYGTFSYWPSDGIGNAIAQGNAWDDWFLPAFDAVPVGSTVVDVGANLGWFTVYAAKRGCRVYAFEPCREVFELLVENIQQNGLSEQVAAFPLALYDKFTKLSALKLTPENPANQIFDGDTLNTDVCRNSGSMKLREIDSGLLTQYGYPLDQFDFQNVALIKTDTEGLDLEILKGAEKTIMRSRPTLCYEYLGPNSDTSPERLAAFNEFIRSIRYVTQEVHASADRNYYDFIARPQEFP